MGEIIFSFDMRQKKFEYLLVKIIRVHGHFGGVPYSQSY
jgi:hypothetical protein